MLSPKMVLQNSTNSTIGLICTLLVWLLPSMSQAQQQWNELGPGLWQTVFEIELNGTDVYAGGNFTNAGGNSAADYVARWDGCQWHPLGSGLNGGVRSIAIVGSDIYVGGLFTLPYPYLVRWDGTQWNPVGSGPSGPVWSIVADGTNIYVGGGTWTSGFAAQWNGSTWQPLGAGLDKQVNDMVMNGSDLYMGGGFNNANGNPDADGVARWDGSTWQNLGSGIPVGAGASVWDLLIYNNELYAGGSFGNAGGNPDADHVARWDGNSWHNLGIAPSTPFDFGFYSICIFQGSIYTSIGAGWNDNDGIYSWDFISGTWEEFQIIILGADDPIIRLECDDENLYVGSFSGLGIPGGDYVCIARWGEPGNSIQIPGITDTVCVYGPPVPLPIVINGITGNWSGTGVINDVFYPVGRNGVIYITFNPDPGQCAFSDESEMHVVNLSSSTSQVFCADNNTPADETDDIIQIEFNPMGYHTGNAYSVSVSAGSISPGIGSYNTTTTFQMQPGSAGNGPLTLTITDNAFPFCSFDFEIEDPGSCSFESTCPPGIDTTYMICPYLEAENNFLVSYGLPPTGTWQPPLQMWGGSVYNSCTDGASVYIYPHDYPGCPTVYDTVHFQLIWDPCGWGPEDVCYTADSIMFTMPPFMGNTSDPVYTLGVSDEPPNWWSSLPNSFDFDSTYEIAVPMPSWYDPGNSGCFQIGATANGCSWLFGELILFDFTCVGGFGGIPPCSCSNPPYAGENNSFNICGDADPFDLTTVLGGNPDPGGDWTPPLNSGGNIYDPDLDGYGTFTYTVSNPGCPDDNAFVLVTNQQPTTPFITGIPNTICEPDPAIALPTTQSGILGNWSGTGVTNNNFNPSGLNGTYVLTFTPNAGQCATPATTNIIVEPFINLVITGVQDSICQIDPPIQLPFNPSGIPGTWSGPGVVNNMFNPVVQSGLVILTFTPAAGQCVNAATENIFVEPAVTPNFTGLPDTVCQNDIPILLPTFQNGISGSWSGPGVSANIFSPANQNGNVTLIFTPAASQCANLVNVNILVQMAVSPSMQNFPNTFCENDNPVLLPVTPSGISGSWSGPGVTAGIFNPAGLNGEIILTFLPDPGQCANVALDTISVDMLFQPVLNLPTVVCETTPPITLSSTQSGIQGNWSGDGVSNNTFNPAGQIGMVTLTFTPMDGQCALVATVGILVETAIIPVITGIPDSLCQTHPSISLLTTQNNVAGNWSGPGVLSNTFNPSNLSGNINLTFTPDSIYCALSATADIMVLDPITPVLSGIPDTICALNSSIILPTLQNGVNGNWSGQGVTLNTFNPEGIAGTHTLTFTPGASYCALTTGIEITVDSSFVPSITGVPTSVCQTGSTLFLPISQSGVTGMWSGPGVIQDSLYPFGLPGTIILEFIPDPGQCADTAQVSLTINDLPTFLNLQPDCDSSAQFYTVSFDITGGLAGSYTVNGVPVNGSVYTSSSIPADSLHYTFLLDDGNSCGPVTIDGSINCACATSAGTMNFAVTPLMICDGSGFSVVYNHDASLDPDDVLLFILHDQAGTSLGTVYAISDTTFFNFPTGIQLNQVYYISAVAGSSNGNGSIDLKDPCLSVSQGIPVIFYIPRVTISPGNIICPDDCITYEFQFAGIGPFVIEFQVLANGISYPKTIISDPFHASITICPSEYGMTDGTLDIVPITLQDSNCTIAIYPQGGTSTTVYNASYDLEARICPGDSLIVHGSVYNQYHLSGTEIFPGASVYGCDSFVNVMLSIYPLAESYLNPTLCYGNSITINGTVYNELNPSGTETLDNADIHGCDSLVHIQIAFDSVAVGNFISTLCAGDSLVVNGLVYHETNASGSQLLPGGSVFGCDSILNIQLEFYSSMNVLRDTLCTEEFILLNGNVYDIHHSTGVEILPFGGQFGCDSIVEVSLTFYPASLNSIIDTLNYGDSLKVNGIIYDSSNPSGMQVIPGGSSTGCDSNIVIMIYFRQSLNVLFQAIAPICYGDSSGVIILESILGGLSPYTYSLNQGNFMAISGFPFKLEGLPPGLYHLTIQDGGSGLINLDIEIPETPPIEVDAGEDHFIHPGENVQLSASSTSQITNWSWYPEDFLSCSNCPDPIVEGPDQDIVYTLTVWDENSCTASDEVSIFLTQDQEIYFPNVFSPNNDGINDIANISSGNAIKQIHYIKIFSRWGELVYEQMNFPPNNPQFGWDGKFNDQWLNPDVFTWVTEIEFTNGKTKLFSGNLTLIR
jgi:gliding motility-associated-like protein